MAAYNKFHAFVEAVAEKKHNLGADQLAVALTNTLPNAANSVLADITQISYTNLSSRNISTASSSQAAGVYSLVLTDLLLTASGSVGPFRYVVIYNDTAANDDLIAWADRGSSLTLEATDTFLVDFDNTAFFTLS